MGKPRKRDPRIRAVELSRDNAGQLNKKFIKNIKLETNSNSYNYDNCMDSCRRYNNSIEHWCSRCYNYNGSILLSRKSMDENMSMKFKSGEARRAGF